MKLFLTYLITLGYCYLGFVFARNSSLQRIKKKSKLRSLGVPSDSLSSATKDIFIKATITLMECDKLPDKSVFIFQDTTSNFITQQIQSSYAVTDLHVLAKVANQQVEAGTKSLLIQLETSMSLQASSKKISGHTMFQQAFDSLDDQTKYITALLSSDDSTFRKVSYVSVVVVSSDDTLGGVTKKTSILLIVMLSSGGGLILTVIAFVVSRKLRCNHAQKVERNLKLSDSYSTNDVDKSSSDEEFFIVVNTMEDVDISTLGGGTLFETQNSLSSLISQYSQDAVSKDNRGRISSQKSNQNNVLPDDSSLSNLCKEQAEMIEVTAPPGLLGMVIDTTHQSIPSIYQIKDSSSIKDKVRVGDKIISINNIDSTRMTARQISKLISKLANAERHFILLRPLANMSTDATRCTA